MNWFSLMPIKNLPPPAFTDADSAQTWLSQMKRAAVKTAGPTEAVISLNDLTEQLERIQGAEMDGFLRATLLETLRQESLLSLAKARHRFTYTVRPLPPEAFSTLTSCQRLWSGLITGYLQCAEEFISKSADPSWIAIAGHRALMAIKLALEDHFVAGVEPPPFLWQHALRIIEMCTELKLSGQTVSDPLFPDQGSSTCLHQYSILALTAFADPYGMTAVEYAAFKRLLLRWRDLCQFSATREDDSKRRWINLRLLETSPRNAAQNPLWLDISLVRSKLKKRIESLQAGESPESLNLGRDLSGADCVRLLETARKKLREAYDPAATSQPQVTGESIYVAHDIEESFNLITGFRYNTNVKAGATSDRVLNDRMALFGHNSIIQDLSAEKPKFGEEWAVRSSANNVINLTNSQDIVRSALQLGQLVTTRQNENIAVAKVTRGLQRQSSKIEISLRAYPGQPKAVEGHVFDQTGQMHFPLLLLPANAETKTPACVFLPSGIGSKVHQPVETNLTTPRKIRLTGLIERGTNFDCYRFDGI